MQNGMQIELHEAGLRGGDATELGLELRSSRPTLSWDEGSALLHFSGRQRRTLYHEMKIQSSRNSLAREI